MTLGVYNNSRKAFNNLFDFSKDKNCKFQEEALNVIENKILDLDLFYNRVSGEFGTHIDVNNKNFDELYNIYKTEISLDNRIYFLESFWESKHSKQEKTDFLIKLFETDIGLKSSYFIGKILVNELKLNVQSYDFRSIKKELIKK